MPSDAQDAIGSIPRRLRGAMRLSQKTCLRSAYRIFGLLPILIFMHIEIGIKRDMFLGRARLRGFLAGGRRLRC